MAADDAPTTDRAEVTLAALLRDAFAAMMRGYHWATIGKVQSYDAATRTCVAQPLVHDEYEDESGVVVSQRKPAIPRAVVWFPRGYRASLAPGDLVLLVICSESTDRLFAGDGATEGRPADRRRGSLADAVALPFERVDPAVGVEVTATEVRAGGGDALVLAAALTRFNAALATAITAQAGNPPGAAALTALQTALAGLVPPWPAAGTDETQVTKGS